MSSAAQQSTTSPDFPPGLKPEDGSAAAAAMSFAQTLTSCVRWPVLVLDPRHTVLAASAKFYEVFCADVSRVPGHPLYQMLDGAWDIPELRHLLAVLLPETPEITDYAVRHSFPGIGAKVLQLNAKKVEVPGVGFPLTVLSIDDFTSLTVAGEALEKSEQRYREIVEILPGVLRTPAAAVVIPHKIFTANAAGEVDFVNELWLEYTGEPASALLGAGWANLVHPDDVEANVQLWQHSVATGEAIEVQHRFRRADGVYRWHLTRASALRDASGNITLWLGSNTDIDEVKQSEEQLRQNQELFFKIIDQAPGGVYVIDHDFRMLTMNALARPDFESAEPVIGRDFREVMRIQWGEKTGGELADIFRHTLDTGERYQAPQFTGKRSDLREEKGYNWETQRLILPNGTYGVVCYFTDITEKLEAERRLRQSEEFNRSIVESSRDCIKILDLEGNLLMLTPLGQKLLCIADLGAILHQPWVNFWQDHNKGKAQQAIADALRGATGSFLGLLCTPAGEEKWWDVQVSAIRDATGKPERLLVVSRDVTERRRADLSTAFLGNISQELGQIHSKEELMVMLREKLADYLKLSGCAFVEIDESRGEACVTHDWHRPEVPGLSGSYQMADYFTDHYLSAGRAGEIFVVEDTSTDPRTAHGNFRALGIGSLIAMPMLREGAWEFELCVHRAEAGPWRPDEIEIVEQVTQRMWARMERLQVQDVLRESEERFHYVADAAPVLIWISDVTKLCTWFNKPWLDFTGRTLEQEYGNGWAERVHPDDFNRCVTIYETNFETRAPFTMEYRLLRHDGEYRWLLDNGVPRFAPSGGFLGFIGTCVDITERRRADEALQQSEALLRQLANAMPQIVWAARTDGWVDYYNQQWYDFTGADPATACETGWLPVLHPDDRAKCSDRWQECVKTGGAYEIEQRFRDARSGEYRWHLGRALAARDEAGEIVRWFGSFTDIDDQKKIEQALAERIADLAQADRSKDEFLGMLAHELRNPLAPMRNAAEILEARDSAPADKEEAQRILQRQIGNMSRMIDDLLDVSRITEGKIELRRQSVELQPILEAAAGLVRSGSLTSGQTFALISPEAPVFLHADSTRLEQVLGNLLMNACKYSGPGSHITLAAAPDPTSAEPHIVITVRDNGHGIPAALLPRIFDLFVQASRSLDRSHGGLGIGLTLVRRLIHLHGGTVEAYSEGLGQGCEFVIRLPVSSRIQPSSAPAAGPPLSASAAADAKSRRILIVDDNQDAARSLAMLHRRRGHIVHTVFTGTDAVQAAREFLPDVVLLDIGLPGMDGFEVARAVRHMPALANAFVVAMSGYGRESDREEADRAGFDQYLVKPLDLSLLQQWLTALP